MLSKSSNIRQRTNTAANPLHPVKTGLEGFVGKWRLNRTILQSNGDEFVFAGQANFTWHEARLLYQEAGLVTAPNGSTLQAERTYFWQLGETNQIDVYFDDERYFHSFSGVAPFADHLCGDDYYKVNYNFDQWPLWESSWQVTGPRKDYRMISRYQPD